MDSNARSLQRHVEKAAGILKRAVSPRDELYIDWVIMGQKTLGLNGKAYAIVVLDVGSNFGAVINHSHT
jgi:hypothetical protein